VSAAVSATLADPTENQSSSEDMAKQVVVRDILEFGIDIKLNGIALIGWPGNTVGA
jgi:hypothetical protein